MSKGAFSDKLIKSGGKMPLPEDKQSNERGEIADIRARQRAIGRELRRMYDEIAREPIPEDFLDLLRELDAKDGNSGNDGE